jgi:cytochrome c oxidase subunit 3
MAESAAAAAVGIEVSEHFATAEQQRHAAILGMWVFLLTELLLFSGLFITALTLRVLHPRAVMMVATHLKTWIGATNTVVLIVSSFSMSVAIEASRIGRQRVMVRAMLVTAALGVVFLLLKSYEYYDDYREHVMPFLTWHPYALGADPATRLFLNLYYITTGIHAVHLTIGIGIMLVMSWLASRPGFLARHQNRIEITGLYWHFIDLIWLIVFPTLYLLNR